LIVASKVAYSRVYGFNRQPIMYAVLVDRLWPRGFSKDAIVWDEWIKDLSPSDSLRRWYGHDPNKYDEFQAKYRAELHDEEDVLKNLVEKTETKILVFLTASKAVDISNAAVLAKYVAGKFGIMLTAVQDK